MLRAVHYTTCTVYRYVELTLLLLERLDWRNHVLFSLARSMKTVVLIGQNQLSTALIGQD
jgi:hypothetical protein